MPRTREPGRHTTPLRERRVRSKGLGLAVREYGAQADAEGATHVVLVHGYPDSQEMWGPLVERLLVGEADDGGFHVVTYDVRGAGESDAPGRIADYHSDLLVDDLVAVLDATVPADARVHLVGHDWGSVQLWEAVLSEADDPRLRGRIASFVSVSGPPMEHVAHLARHPRGRTLRLLRQLGRSWYVLAFQVPLVPELMWRTAHRPLGAVAARLDGATGSWGPGLGRNGANGVNLYRANLRRGPRGDRTRRTCVPVLVVAPRRDPFLTAVTIEDLDQVCSVLEVVRPDAGHWLPRSHPDLLAGLVRDHVAAHS